MWQNLSSLISVNLSAGILFTKQALEHQLIKTFVLICSNCVIICKFCWNAFAPNLYIVNYKAFCITYCLSEFNQRFNYQLKCAFIKLTQFSKNELIKFVLDCHHLAYNWLAKVNYVYMPVIRSWQRACSDAYVSNKFI